jgi:hypothetical protein
MHSTTAFEEIDEVTPGLKLILIGRKHKYWLFSKGKEKGTTIAKIVWYFILLFLLFDGHVMSVT